MHITLTLQSYNFVITLNRREKAQSRFCPDSSVTHLLRGFLSRAPCKGAFLLNSSWNAHFQDRPVHNHRDVLLYS